MLKLAARPNLKSEIRNPKSERSPNTEFRIVLSLCGLRVSHFGLRICFGFRISDFGFQNRLGRARFGLVFGLVLSWAALAGLNLSHATDSHPVLSAWLAAQTNFQTWSADFTQTRTLKSLTQPLIATGHVWFAAPNRFRWELGSPAQTIAVRQPDQMLVIYPRLNRAERYPLNGEHNGAWKDTLALLEAGFPRSQRELENRFRVLSLLNSNEVCEAILQPRSPAARRMMPQIKVAFGTSDFSLRATELQFADGSTMRNDFTNAQVNLKLEETVFAPKLEAEVKVVEPLKR